MSTQSLLPLRRLVETHREQIKSIAFGNRGTSIAIVGSVARGEEDADSDIDFLVEMEDDASLFDLGKMLLDLRDRLGCNVDLIDRGSLEARDEDLRKDAILL